MTEGEARRWQALRSKAFKLPAQGSTGNQMDMLLSEDPWMSVRLPQEDVLFQAAEEEGPEDPEEEWGQEVEEEDAHALHRGTREAVPHW